MGLSSICSWVLLRDLGFGVCSCYRAVFRRCYLLLDGDSLQGAQDGDRFNRLSHLVYFDIFDRSMIDPS